MGFEMQDVERKVLSILKVLSDSPEPQGARIIARRLKDHGVELGERAVRYHLKMMDERGLTRLVQRDGRLITELGLEEVRSALVKDKVGLAISKIELLAFRTDFNWDKRNGSVPVNVSFFLKEKFNKNKITLKDDEFNCRSCQKAVKSKPENLSLTFTGRKLGTCQQVFIKGVCSVCNNKLMRFSSDKRIKAMIDKGTFKELKKVLSGNLDNCINTDK